MYLCGHPGPLRRQIVLEFAKICGMEVEYLPISRDTTESDIKQRKEIKGTPCSKITYCTLIHLFYYSHQLGDSVIFYDQAPVRAAIHGRLLILDGIENAERNVLPTLNNLLENREMALEDGRFLMNTALLSHSSDLSGSRVVPVHPDFRVIALGEGMIGEFVRLRMIITNIKHDRM
jgi:MoxR-like ATPase